MPQGEHSQITEEFSHDREDRSAVSTCPALEAMERMGREVLTCEPVEGAQLAALADTVDKRIRVKPLKLPPRQSRDEICCCWLLSLEDDNLGSIHREPKPQIVPSLPERLSRS